MKRKNNIFRSIISFISLFISIKLFSKILSSFDYEAELLSNEQLQKADDNTKNDMKLKLIDLTIKRGILLRRKTLKSIAWLFSAFIIAVVLSLLLKKTNINCLSKNLLNSLFPILSMFFFALGTLGRIGYEGQSWCGTTVYEKLDSQILWMAYFFGMLFGVLSFL